MAGPRIHLDLPLRGGLGRQAEDDRSVGIGVTQFDRRAPVRGDDADGGIKVEASDGTIEFGTGDLPPTWPSEVPPPPGFEVIMAGSTGGDTNWTGSFQAPGDQMAAVDAYVRDLMNRGFAVDGDIPLGANGMYGLVGNGYQVDMLAVNMGETTQVTMRITPLS